jgi:integrase/recombinase XerD
LDITSAQLDWRFACEGLNYSPKAIAWNEQKGRRFAEWLADQGVHRLEEITVPLVHRFLASLPAELSDHTRKGYAQSIKAWMMWCAREDLIPERLPKRISMPKVTDKVIQTFTPEQVKRLLAACDHEPLPWMRSRDRAILSVLFDTGIRAGELVGLTLENVHFGGTESYIQVTGKGRKQRTVGLGAHSRTELHRWLYRHRNAAQGQSYVFLGARGDRLQVGGVWTLFRRLRDHAGEPHFKGVRVSPHTARHTWAVAFLTGGGDVYVLSRLMGHSSVAISEVYLKTWQNRMARRGTSVLDTWTR